eukprot:EC850668.1.p2 GENE.EC850668.1~~EC850668.1.p2  ORF type:complete len:148 (+),score=55.67 EC850668.1:44-445(+)
MKTAFVALLVLCLGAFVVANINDPFVHDDEMISYINNSNSTWVAGHNPRFIGVRMSEVKKLLGAKLDRAFAEHLAEPTVLHLKAIPDTFDARTQWPSASTPSAINNNAALAGPLVPPSRSLTAFALLAAQTLC